MGMSYGGHKGIDWLVYLFAGRKSEAAVEPGVGLTRILVYNLFKFLTYDRVVPNLNFL